MARLLRKQGRDACNGAKGKLLGLDDLVEGSERARKRGGCAQKEAYLELKFQR